MATWQYGSSGRGAVLLFCASFSAAASEECGCYSEVVDFSILCRFRRICRPLSFAIVLSLGAGKIGSQVKPLPESVDPRPTLTFERFANARTIHMVAYGDTRFTDPSVTSGTNPRVRKWLVDRIAQEHPEVLLITGDTPFTGAKQADWKVFQDETAPWRAEHFLQLPTTGNHEAYGGLDEGITNYLDHFPDIERHRFYSALLGNVEVISLDMTGDDSGGGKQAHWFATQLEHIPRQVDFLMILYHMPWMADEQSQILVGLPSQDALMFRDVLEGHLNQIRPKIIVFNGHIHNYERFERRGVEYVVTGGGGAEPYPLLVRGPSDLYHDHPRGLPVYHYLTVDVSGRTLHATMWKVKDPESATLTVEAKDSFTLTAPPEIVKPKGKPEAKTGVH